MKESRRKVRVKQESMLNTGTSTYVAKVEFRADFDASMSMDDCRRVIVSAYDEAIQRLT